jgi:hypothetical protein
MRFQPIVNLANWHVRGVKTLRAGETFEYHLKWNRPGEGAAEVRWQAVFQGVTLAKRASRNTARVTAF